MNAVTAPAQAELLALMTAKGISQRDLAAAVPTSPATINLILKHNNWPKRGTRQIAERINQFLTTQLGQPISLIPPAPIAPSNPPEHEENPMLLRRQNLTPAAKKAFGLFTNPFAGEIQSAADLFQTPDTRYVRESLLHTAKHGGFIAVIGESGAGKSTLRRDLMDRLEREKTPVILIEPYVLATEDNDIKGKTLKSAAIAEAILAAIAPHAKAKTSSEGRFRQVHQLLRESSRAGNKHVLIIEEAHSLPIPTLKHLKRFFELEDGYTKLLGIVLIGQNELAIKLSENNPEVREVVQRCEIVTLEPLTPSQLPEYLAHRLKASAPERKLSELIDDSGIDALADRLSFRGQTRRGHHTSSLLYPLAIGNLLTASLNLAAELGAPLVSRDVVMEV